MNTTYIVLLILVLIYIPTFIFVKRSEKAKAMGIVTSGPLIMIKTKVGIKLMDRLCVYRRFWRACGILSRLITVFLMAFIVSILVIDLIMIPRMTSTGGLGIEYALAIPGINPMLPIVYGWIALIIAMVVHEFAHGVQTRANDMEVESTGIIHAVVPLGAFVEPNEEQVQKCSRGARMDLYAAGITTNFILAMLMFGILCAGMTGGLATDYGDNPALNGVVADSPGYYSKIPSTAIILSIGFEDLEMVEVDAVQQLYDYIDSHHFGHYSMEYLYHDEKKTAKLPLGTYIVGVVEGSPADGVLKKNTFLISFTELSTGKVTEIGTANDFVSFMKTTEPYSAYEICYYNSETDTMETGVVTLGEKSGYGYLGISTTTSGMSFTTPNTVLRYGIDPFFGRDTFTTKMMGMLTFVGNVMSGYSPIPEATHWWFHSTSLPDDMFWVAMTMVYWIFWLNIVLGITNAIPAIPFDGGFLFMGGLSFIFEKFGMRDEEKRENLVERITKVVSYFMIFTLILVIVIMVI